MLHRRVCFYAGPGAGKSTTALLAAHILRKAGQMAELIREEAKSWAYAGRPISPLDQVVVSARQFAAEYDVLRVRDVVAVTESPVLLGAAYGSLTSQRALCRELEAELATRFKTLSVFIDRQSKPYDRRGRFQDWGEAVAKDTRIRRELDRAKVPYVVLPYGDDATLRTLLLGEAQPG